MSQQLKEKKQIVTFIPVFGILIFVALYIYSSTRYPGGSQANINTVGFDWIHNYWCNLMNEKGVNGQLNPARPFAISAMIILCFSLAVFFVQFAKYLSSSKLWKLIIMYSGIISMLFAVLIFTEYHDLMTIISSVFGLFTVIGIIKEIYKSNLIGYKLSGLCCILLLGLNNYIYYTKHFIEVLPLLQKITFATILIWILGLNNKLYKQG